MLKANFSEIVAFCVALSGCGSSLSELRQVTSEQSGPRTSTAETAGSGSSTSDAESENPPVIPPQPVIGSYLAAAFEIPGRSSRDDCVVSIRETDSQFASELNDSAYMLLPVGSLANLQSISVDCKADATQEAFAARRVIDEADKQQFSKISVANPEAPVAYVVRFTPNHQSLPNPPSSGPLRLDYKIFQPSDLVNSAPAPAPAAPAAPAARAPAAPAAPAAPVAPAPAPAPAKAFPFPFLID